MAAAYGLEDMTRFTDHLGKYFLFLTRTGENEIKLMDEIEHAKIYGEIQKIRFANRIENDIWTDIPDEYRSIQVPRLILQPLLENAYKYGLEQKTEHGILQIRSNR